MNHHSKLRIWVPCAAAATLALAGVAVQTASAVVVPGTPAKDVHIGLDNDNAANPFIQPPGVTARQDMDDADVVFGRGNDDLLIGNLGSDTLLGGPGSDIMVGGPEGGHSPSSDVLVGDLGDDVAIWSPGDGNDAYVANEGTDAMIFAPLVTNADGSLRLETRLNRKVPRVTIDGQPDYGCTLVKVPDSQNLGVEYLVRFTVHGTIVATVRQKDVERVYCPSPTPGFAQLATLTDPNPAFHPVTLSSIGGVTGAIVAPLG